MIFRITHYLCLYVGKKKIYKFKGSHPAALRSCEAVEVQRIEGKKQEVRVGCD